MLSTSAGPKFFLSTLIRIFVFSWSLSFWKSLSTVWGSTRMDFRGQVASLEGCAPACSSPWCVGMSLPCVWADIAVSGPVHPSPVQNPPPHFLTSSSHTVHPSCLMSYEHPHSLFPSDLLFQFVLRRAIIELLWGVSHKSNFRRLKEPHENEIDISVNHPGCGWEEVQDSCLNLCLLAPVSQILLLLRGQIRHEFKSWLDWGLTRVSRNRWAASLGTGYLLEIPNACVDQDLQCPLQ